MEFTVEWQHQSSLLNNYYIILLSVGYEGGHASLIFEVISDFFSEFLSKRAIFSYIFFSAIPIDVIVIAFLYIRQEFVRAVGHSPRLLVLEINTGKPR